MSESMQEAGEQLIRESESIFRRDVQHSMPFKTRCLLSGRYEGF